MVGRESLVADSKRGTADCGDELLGPVNRRGPATNPEVGAAERSDSTFPIGDRLQRMEDSAGDATYRKGIQQHRTMRARRVEGDSAAHAAVGEIVNHGRNSRVRNGDENPIGVGRNVADARRFDLGADKRCGALRVVRCPAGHGDDRDAGVSEEPAQGLRNPAGSHDRRARSGQLTAANVRFSQLASADTRSALTLRSVRLPYSRTSPVTAGTSR